MLNEDGIPQKHGYEKWLPSSINYVLNNERYMGDALLQKSYTTETLPFRKMKNDGRLPQYYVENSNPAIVSRETFQAAQNLLRSRKTERCKRKSYPLTGKLRCPECGRAFRHKVINGKAHRSLPEYPARQPPALQPIPPREWRGCGIALHTQPP